MKKLLGFLSLVLILFAIVGCSANSENRTPGGEESGAIELESTAARKIIYDVNMNIETKKVKVVFDALLALTSADIWVYNSSYSADYSTVVLRVKTETLDAFIQSIDNTYHVKDYRKSASDVTVSYYDKQSRIISLEAEQANLVLLYSGATIEQSIAINKRLSEIDTELRTLNGEINNYDSLIEYSTVTIRIRSTATFFNLTFGAKAWAALKGGFIAFIRVVELIFYAFLALLPFAIVGVPAVWGIVKLNRHLMNKRKQKSSK